MDLNEGLALESPQITIPWGLSRRELVRDLTPYGLRKTHPCRHSPLSQYTLRCVLFSGLSHELQIHFDFNSAGANYRFQFVRKDFSDRNRIHIEYDDHLRKTFGPPTIDQPYSELLTWNEWKFDGIAVTHMVSKTSVDEEAITIYPRGYGSSRMGRALQGVCDAFLGPFWPLTLGYCVLLGTALLVAWRTLRNW